MLTSEYREQLQDERDADWFQTVWGAYTVTLADARHAFGDSAAAFFSDIHQSALASALIAYRKQQTTAIDHVRALHYQDGDYCAVCTVDFGRLNAPWPCATIRALENKEPTS